MTTDSLSPTTAPSPERVLALEQRILQLEVRVRQLEEKLSEQRRNTTQLISSWIPETALLSSNFLKRAFAAWGHVFVAQLIIAAPIYCLLFILSGWGNR